MSPEEMGKLTAKEKDVIICNKQIDSAQSQVVALETFVDRVTDARKALDICADTFKTDWRNWTDSSVQMLADLRNWRMAIDGELSTTLKKFQDVRMFFMSETHITEVARLKEFVELCERLKALKDSGFLDKVTDTILRLEVHE